MGYERKMQELIFAIKEAKKRNCNINLLIGAGCSVTAGIPLANKIIEELKEKYPFEMCRLNQETYAECMSKLTHIERRLFIADYVKNAKVNWGHICIALLMKQNYINRVLTTNFDNLLPRACAMVGEFPGIYDLALTTTTKFRSDLLLDNSIIYLHGQHTGFILCNTDDEVQSQKDNIEPIFKELNKNSLWIIVGYSGNNDAIFQLFTEVRPFENRLYWVGFKNNEPSNLIKDNLLSSRNYAFYIKGYDSDTFFINLAKQFGLFPPSFIKEPFTYAKNIFEEIEASGIRNLETDEVNNLLPYTFKILDKAIYEIENEVKMIAQLYVKNLDYYVDEFQDLMNNNINPLDDDIIDALTETLDEKINESNKQLNTDILQIDRMIEHDKFDLNIIPLAIRILENINICMIRQSDEKNDYYIVTAKKYFEICKELDQNNTKLINLIAKIFNKFYSVSSSNEKIEYLLKSLDFYIKILSTEFNKEAINGVIDVIENIITSDLENANKLEKIRTVISVVINNSSIPDVDKKIVKSIITLEYTSLINNMKESTELLNNSISEIEEIYEKDKSKQVILELLINLNHELINVMKDDEEHDKTQYVTTLDQIIILSKTKKNFCPNEVEHTICYIDYLIEKYIFLINEDEYIDDRFELAKCIMENIKSTVNIICTDYKTSSDEAIIARTISRFVYQDKMDLRLMDLIKKEYKDFIEVKINLGKDTYLKKIININNLLCYSLINKTNYIYSNFHKYIFDFTKTVIDVSLSKVKDNYLTATNGFWYFNNIYIDDCKSEEEGYKLYEESIKLCEKEEKEFFKQKMYLELAKFYFYRLAKPEEAIIYCNKGVEIGKILYRLDIYEELDELLCLLMSENNVVLALN